ncbi:MAG: tetratricopeptide repeat protein, partial [Phycisphaerae bacterium]|nr:tetratricopeptide repeat protein [Phycisphaerae bacterium]
TQTVWWIVARVARIDGGEGRVELNPAAFHLLNLLVHLGASVACLELLHRLIGRRWPAALGALVFAVHPVQVEAVCWTAATKDLLAGLFSWIALGLFVTTIGLERAGGAVTRLLAGYGLSALMFILAMLSKPSAVVVPLMGLILDRWVIGSPWRGVLIRLVVGLGLAMPIAIIAREVQPGHEVATVPVPQRLLVAADALAFYLWKLIWPVNLTFDYGRTPAKVLAQSWVVMTSAVPVIVALVAGLAWKRWRLVPVSGLLLLAGVFPVLGLVPFDFQIYSTVSDHYLYLAMTGPGLLSAWLARGVRGAGGVAILVAIGSIVSARQVWTWRDLEAVSRQGLHVNPYSWTSYNNLSAALASKGRIEPAVAAGRKAVELRPDLLITRQTLCGALTLQADGLAAQGRYSEAIQVYQQALEILPSSPGAWTNLAATYAEIKAYDKAIHAYEKALSFDPSFPAAVEGLNLVRKLQASGG